MAYIDVDKFADAICEFSAIDEHSANAVISLLRRQPTADVVEVKHGKWHILSEDPCDESGSPTEEGWYRIITDDGEEMTDYFFGKPTLTGTGCAYWKNCKKRIRAWAKMDGKENSHETN